MLSHSFISSEYDKLLQQLKKKQSDFIRIIAFIYFLWIWSTSAATEKEAVRFHSYYRIHLFPLNVINFCSNWKRSSQISFIIARSFNSLTRNLCSSWKRSRFYSCYCAHLIPSNMRIHFKDSITEAALMWITSVKTAYISFPQNS